MKILKKELEGQGKINVVLDEDTLNITYDTEEIKKQKVKVNENDFLVSWLNNWF